MPCEVVARVALPAARAWSDAGHDDSEGRRSGSARGSTRPRASPVAVWFDWGDAVGVVQVTAKCKSPLTP